MLRNASRDDIPARDIDDMEVSDNDDPIGSPQVSNARGRGRGRGSRARGRGRGANA